jgi:hypothetical protein
MAELKNFTKTLPASTRVALMSSGLDLCTLSVRHRVFATIVTSGLMQCSWPSYEKKDDEQQAVSRLREAIRHAPCHNWTVFYDGPPLQG